MFNFNPAQKNTPISMHWVNITPNQAQRILDHSNTADVIRLCVHGGSYAALDGQHRLGGIVKSDKAQDTWVALDVPPEAFKYIDQGAPRTLSHVMTAAGWEKFWPLLVVCCLTKARAKTPLMEARPK